MRSRRDIEDHCNPTAPGALVKVKRGKQCFQTPLHVIVSNLLSQCCLLASGLADLGLEEEQFVSRLAR